MSHSSAQGALRLALALGPLALVPGLVHGIASGWLDLGGGEKDLVWVLPWTVWSAGFATSSLFLWRRGWALARASARSAIAGLVAVLVGAALLAAFGQLGVGGRF